MRLAISIPQFYVDGAFDPVGFGAYMRRADALGFESAWVQEGVLGTMPQLGPIETMTYAAACSERIRLGCAVFVTTAHSPAHLAKSLSTLDQLSRGRLEVGVGLGRPDILPAFGADPATRVTRFDEALRVMTRLWTEPRVTFQGRFYRLEDAAMEPKPFQKPRPPVWFGASHPAALARAVRHGDGFFGAGSASTAQFADQVRTVRALLERAGRDPRTFPIAKRVYVVVEDDAARARRRAGEFFEAIYHRPGMEDVAVYGPPEACIDGIRAVADAGAELILFTTVFDPAAQMERLAGEIAPHLG